MKAHAQVNAVLKTSSAKIGIFKVNVLEKAVGYLGVADSCARQIGVVPASSAQLGPMKARAGKIRVFHRSPLPQGFVKIQVGGSPSTKMAVVKARADESSLLRDHFKKGDAIQNTVIDRNLVEFQLTQRGLFYLNTVLKLYGLGARRKLRQTTWTRCRLRQRDPLRENQTKKKFKAHRGSLRFWNFAGQEEA